MIQVNDQNRNMRDIEIGHIIHFKNGSIAKVTDIETKECYLLSFEHVKISYHKNGEFNFDMSNENPLPDCFEGFQIIGYSIL